MILLFLYWNKTQTFAFSVKWKDFNEWKKDMEEVLYSVIARFSSPFFSLLYDIYM